MVGVEVVLLSWPVFMWIMWGKFGLRTESTWRGGHTWAVSQTFENAYLHVDDLANATAAVCCIISPLLGICHKQTHHVLVLAAYLSVTMSGWTRWCRSYEVLKICYSASIWVWSDAKIGHGRRPPRIRSCRRVEITMRRVKWWPFNMRALEMTTKVNFTSLFLLWCYSIIALYLPRPQRRTCLWAIASSPPLSSAIKVCWFWCAYQNSSIL